MYLCSNDEMMVSLSTFEKLVWEKSYFNTANEIKSILSLFTGNLFGPFPADERFPHVTSHSQELTRLMIAPWDPTFQQKVKFRQESSFDALYFYGFHNSFTILVECKVVFIKKRPNFEQFFLTPLLRCCPVPYKHDSDLE